MLYNYQHFGVPVLRGDRSWHLPLMPWGMVPNVNVDPFVAIIQHSCMGNAYLTYEGSELRIRALKPISKDEEILMPWFEFSLAFGERTRRLSRAWNLTCGCQACSSQRTQVPTPANKLLEENGRKLLELKPELENLSRLPDIERAISGLRGANLEAGSHLMRLLLHRAIHIYCGQKRLEDVLKNYLRIYYVVERNALPPTRRLERLATLHTLRSILDPRPPEMVAPDEPRLPGRINLLMTNIYPYVSTGILECGITTP